MNEEKRVQLKVFSEALVKMFPKCEFVLLFNEMHEVEDGQCISNMDIMDVKLVCEAVIEQIDMAQEAQENDDDDDAEGVHVVRFNQ